METDMKTTTTVKRFLNIPYKMIVKKIYKEESEEGLRINLIEKDVYFFGLKITNSKMVR